MNFLKTVSFYFISFILFEFLLLIPNSFSSPQVAVSKENKDRLPSVSLVGVMVSKNTSSIAVIKNEKTGKTKVLTIGESILGLKLINVFENRIILERDEKTFQIFLGRSNLTSIAEKLQESPSRVSVNEQKENLLRSDQLNKNIVKIEFNRAEVEKRIETELSSIVSETRFVPNNVKGKIRGFKIIKFPEKTILSEIGIRENDVIKEVDGTEINDFPTIFGLFNKFREKNRFEVIIERDGQLIRILYVLK